MRQPTTTIHPLLARGAACGLLLALALPLSAQAPATGSASKKTHHSPARSARRLGKTGKSGAIVRPEIDRDGRKSAHPAAKAGPTSRHIFVKEEEEDGKDRGDYEHVLERIRLLHAGLHGAVDWNKFAAERDKALKPGARLQSVTPLGGSNVGAKMWQFIGPSNIAPPYQTYYGTQPLIGRVNAVAFAPGSPRTFYLGGATGGVWKTTNAGATWTPLMDSQASLGISSIVVDPNNPNVVYAGTGDYDGGASPGFGILKSVDGGQNWVNLDPNHTLFGPYAIRKILIDPSSIDPITGQSRNILATLGAYLDGGGVVRSTNSGANWTTTLSAPGAVSNVVYNSDRSLVYAAVDNKGIYKSTDNGQSWTGPITGGGGPGGRMDVAASLIDPNTVYTLSGGAQHVFKSINAGASWKNADGTFLAGQFGQSFYDFYIACSTATTSLTGVPSQGVTKDAVYVGLFSIYQSPDGGLSWQDGALSYVPGTLAHSDQHAIAFNPTNPNDALVGGDGGVYRMPSAPTSTAPFSYGFKFASLNRTLGITQFYNGAVSPIDPTQILGGTQDNATPHADGDTVNWKNPGAGDGFGCAINPSDPFNPNISLRGPQNQYLTVYGNDVHVTENDWATQLDIPIPAPALPEKAVFVTPLVMNAADPLFVYTATNFYLYQYTHPALGAANTNTTWTKFGQDMSGGTGDPAYDPNDSVTAIGTVSSNVAFLYTGMATGKFWVSQDQGSSWLRADRTGQPGGLPAILMTNGLFGYPITVIVPSPANPKKVMVALGGGGASSRLWVCNDVTRVDPADNTKSRAVWTPVATTGLPDIPVLTMVMLPHQDEQALYLGNDIGVYFSPDGGQTWRDVGFPLGLPHAIINQLVFSPGTGHLHAFTYGRGVWRMTVGNDVPINIYPNLQGYRGDRTRLTAILEFTKPGGTTVIETRAVNLTPSGWIATGVSYQGQCDILIKIPGFLHKKLRNVSTSATSIITPLMYIGDVDRDNTVSGADVAAVSKHINQYWTGPEDVDGDGRVTQNDLNLVSANVGRVGD